MVSETFAPAALATRRRFLKTTAAGLLLSPFVPRLAAQAPEPASPSRPPLPTPANPGHFVYQVGDFTVVALYDGGMRASPELLQNAGADALERQLRDEFQPLPFPLSILAFAIIRGDQVTLVDAGGGSLFGDIAGRFAKNLHAVGIAPEHVTSILVTHAHRDHIGGLLDGNGEAVFPHAEFIIHQREHDYWLDDAQANQAPEPHRSFFASARQALAAYAKRTRKIDGGEVLPGITAVPAFGHTPGHTGYRLDSGGHSLLIWGDIVHVPFLQFQHPEVTLVFDVDPDTAKATRARVLDQVSADRLAVAGSHLHLPSIGHVGRAGDGYRWVPSLWQGA